LNTLPVFFIQVFVWQIESDFREKMSFRHGEVNA